MAFTFTAEINLNEREYKALRELCDKQLLNEEQILMQALRYYQRIVLATPEQQEKIDFILNGSPVGCPAVE